MKRRETTYSSSTKSLTMINMERTGPKTVEKDEKKLTDGEDWAKDGRVVDCGTIPTTMPELELTLTW